MGQKQILFVDDDPLLLMALKRLFRRQQQWQVHFVESAQAALELLEHHPMDLLVTDMYMPGLTGDELLATVAEKYPAIARIVLSGHADPEKSARAAIYAHQCLAKPCDFDTLTETISSLLSAQDIVQSPRIREFMGNIGNLPSLPRIFQELSEAMKSDHCDSKRVAAIISKDIAMSAKLLQLVNSSFFGLGRKVSSVSEAVMLLGIKQMRALLLGTHVFESFPCQRLANCREMVDQLWKRSLQVAELAQAICLAEKQGGDHPDQAFIGGLLHKVGILIFLCRQSEACARVMEGVNGNRPLLEVEREIIGVTHPEAGAYILGMWGLPSRIVEAVLLHPTPGRLEHDSLCSVTSVHVASALLSEPRDNLLGVWATQLDLAYLEQIGRLDRLDHWRELAESIRNRSF
jgi:HD-like signal output (HDOD) protein/CheY-like chemotaxis protein